MWRKDRSDDSSEESSGLLDRTRSRFGGSSTGERRGLLDRSERGTDDSSKTSEGLLDRARRRSGESTTTEPEPTESKGFVGRTRSKYGLGPLLVGVGILLLVFPEPITSTVGLVVIGAGVLLWVASKVG